MEFASNLPTGVGDIHHLIHITTVAHSLGFLRGQPDFMADHGIEMEAITSPGELVDPMSEDLGIPVHTVEMPRSITPFRDLFALREMTTLIRELDPDIVHAHTPKGGLLGTIAATLAEVPIRLYQMRGLPFETQTGWKRTLLKTTETVSTGLADQTISVGHSIRQTALDEGICRPSDITVLGHGSGQGVDAKGRFDPARFDDDLGDRIRRRLEIPTDATVVGFVGRLVRDKGVVELAEAWQTIREQFVDAHLMVAGHFEERDPVPGTTRSILEGDPRIHLLGFRDDIDELYNAMDLLVLPTHREGFPNVPLEAASMKLPVVVSGIGPCRETIVEGETGLCFPVGHAEELADALRIYLDDPELRRQHGRTGRQRVLDKFLPEFIWEEMAQLYVEYLDDVS